ncbi:MAG: hypothetical protein ETSY2_35035 [Candidatus Entotheonella gemina]|uniref:SMODS and SLOG-associating 2TM effector domain-containing protein n=1 Tax=Candidatus Entotheonella gemina TaxID=1429439 RepID=W4LXR8_9BACT|nr:MAG: hypothetical protein ETSY2_35035 [Candidatus Entotheonella gemina]
MVNQNSDDLDKSFYSRLNDYYKYLYEEEKEITSYLNDKAKTYLIFLTFTFTSILGAVKIFQPIISINQTELVENTLITNIVLFSFGISFFSFMISFVFTILALRLRKYEMLYDAEHFYEKALLMRNENELLQSIISNYVVSTKRDFEVNERRASLLYNALDSYIIGLILLVISATLYVIFL